MKCIKSQDKKAIMPAGVIAIDKTKIVYIGGRNLVLELGTYESEKRAAEIYAEIEEMLADDSCKIYQMPEK